MTVLAQSSTSGAIELVQIITTLDVPALIALFALAIYRGWLHTPREIRRLEEDVTFWRTIAMESLTVGEAVVEERE